MRSDCTGINWFVAAVLSWALKEPSVLFPTIEQPNFIPLCDFHHFLLPKKERGQTLYHGPRCLVFQDYQKRGVSSSFGIFILLFVVQKVNDAESLPLWPSITGSGISYVLFCKSQENKCLSFTLQTFIPCNRWKQDLYVTIWLPCSELQLFLSQICRLQLAAEQNKTNQVATW